MEAETNERTKAASKLSEMCKALKVEEFFWEILEICNDPDSNQLSLAPLLINLLVSFGSEKAFLSRNKASCGSNMFAIIS